jgi:hypothetical protein
MCFSENADIVAGAVLTPIGIAALREVRCWREIPFASLPMIFAIHQFIEAFVWASADGNRNFTSGAGHIAAVAYVAIALPLLPTLLPLSVILLEPRKARARVTPFLVLGLIVTAYLTITMIRNPVTVTVHEHSLGYGTGVSNGAFWSVLYVVAVIGPSILSGYRTIFWFGLFNLIGLVTVAVLYVEAFASFWCILAAIASILVLLHMIDRRRLPDADRMHALKEIIPHVPHIPGHTRPA